MQFRTTRWQKCHRFFGLNERRLFMTSRTILFVLLSVLPITMATTAEPTAEPLATAETSGEPEVLNEPENAPTAEAEGPTPEPDDEPQPYSEAGGTPNAAEIIIPPVILMFVIVLGLSVLMIKAKMKRDRYADSKLTEDYFMQPSLRNLASSFGGAEMAGVQEMREASKYAFLSLSDIDTIHSMELFFNRPLPLCRIALPALLSLAFCPLVLYIYAPVAQFFWPPSDHPEGVPDINDAIACFLMPAGLVYATSFGFSYQSAMEKQRSLIGIVSNEVSKLDQIIVMTSHLTYITLKEKAMIYRYVKDEAVTIIRQIQGVCLGSTEDYQGATCSGQIWRIVPILRNSGARQKKWHLDRHVLDSLMDKVLGLNSDSSERYEVMMTRIHPLKWLFLEALGFFAFFGVLLLDAQSYRMELAMCIMTVFSITILCYVVADLDSPFNGFFRVNLSALPDIVDKASVFYEHAIEGKHVDGPADPGPLTHENSYTEKEAIKKTSSHSINEVVIETFDVEKGV